jgi:adenylate cyclase, class 2
MQTEIEAKFLHVEHNQLREKLQKLGATCKQPMRLMRRRNYDYPDERLSKQFNGWVRLRDEGDKVTLSYKQLNDRTLHGTKEVSVVVDDFAASDSLLQAIGLEQNSYQETKRESWHLDDVEIELDVWPWIDPMLEIEGPSETAVRVAAEKLGLKWEDATHGSVEIAYQNEYDVSEDEIDRWEEITFTPTPDWLEVKRKKVLV